MPRQIAEPKMLLTPGTHETALAVDSSAAARVRQSPRYGMRSYIAFVLIKGSLTRIRRLLNDFRSTELVPADHDTQSE